jgi:hypothetical protein
MELRIQLLAIAASAVMLFVVLELVRRRAFLERYALLWLLSALVLLALSIWSGMLEALAKVVGIAYPPNALFLVAFGFVLILLLHFSLAVSRLSDQTKLLAQRLALLEQHQARVELPGPSFRSEPEEQAEQDELTALRSAERRGRVSAR